MQLFKLLNIFTYTKNIQIIYFNQNWIDVIKMNNDKQHFHVCEKESYPHVMIDFPSVLHKIITCALGWRNYYFTT